METWVAGVEGSGGCSMSALPLFQDQDQTLMLLQTRWKSILDPLLKNSIVNGNQVNGVSINGQKAIPHGLGRAPVGWFLTDINGASTVYRSAAFDANNLTLTSSANVTISIWVY